jgi:hypothetical protein
MSDLFLSSAVHAVQAAHAAADASAAAAPAAGGGSSTLMVVTVAGIAVFLTARLMTTALKVFSSLLGAAVKVGTAVIALGFGALALGVIYVANMLFSFVPS